MIFICTVTNWHGNFPGNDIKQEHLIGITIGRHENQHRDLIRRYGLSFLLELHSIFASFPMSRTGVSFSNNDPSWMTPAEEHCSARLDLSFPRCWSTFGFLASLVVPLS